MSSNSFECSQDEDKFNLTQRILTLLSLMYEPAETDQLCVGLQELSIILGVEEAPVIAECSFLESINIITKMQSSDGDCSYRLRG